MTKKLPLKDRRTKESGAKHSLSPRAVSRAMKTERRFDEYLRLQEIRQQNAMWYRTVAVSVLLNAVLLAFAWIGARG